MDATTGIILVILLLVGFLMVRSTRKKKELPPDDDPRLKVNLGEGGPSGGATETTANTANTSYAVKRNQRSLDAEYALSHGMWVCGHCETLNENGLYNCKVCGASK